MAPYAIPTPNEANLQTLCVTWFNNRFPQYRGLLFSVPNEGHRSNGGRMKHMGLTAGIPDMIFCFMNRAYFIEFKTETGKVSPVQQKVQDTLREHQFEVYIIRDERTFQQKIINILSYHNKL